MLMNLVPLVPPRKLHGLRPEMGLSETRVPQTHLVYHRFPFVAILGYTQMTTLWQSVTWFAGSPIGRESHENPQSIPIGWWARQIADHFTGSFSKVSYLENPMGRSVSQSRSAWWKKILKTMGFLSWKYGGKCQIQILKFGRNVWGKEVGGEPWCLNGF
jgi:hypothetical protein